MSGKKFKFKNGDKVVDRLTGFSGIVTAVVEYLNGCIRYQIQPPINDEGEYRESVIIDEQQLDLIVEKKEPVTTKKPGGDRPGIKSFVLPKYKI